MRRPPQLMALAALVSLFALPAAAQSVDEIVSKNLEAKGGLALLRQTNSVKMTGTFTAFQPPAAPGEAPAEVTMAMTTWAKRPSFVRREVEVPAPAGQAAARGPSRPTKVISAADGSTVWMQQGTNPPVELPAAQASQMLQNSEFDSVFVAYHDKDITIDLVGVEKLNGKDAYHLAVKRKNGPVQQYFLDRETGLETRVVTDVSQGGSTAKISTELSDYRNVDGRMVPFKMRQLVDGQPAAEMAIDRVEFNVDMPDSLFKLPR
jgi:outer membrane lipoprotein-sorting protein